MWMSLYILVAVLRLTSAQWHRQQLMTDLFANYSKHVRPNDFREPTDVKMLMYPLYLVGLDERGQTFRLKISLTMNWYDKRLTWNPEDYGGVTVIYLPQSHIWRPEICIINSVVGYVKWGYDDLVLRNFNNGSVSWTVTQKTKTSCDIDVSFYPFDVQTCTLDFAFYPVPSNEVNTTASGIVYEWLNAFTRGGEWTSDELQVDEIHNQYDNLGFHLVRYTFVLRRRSMYHIIKILIPVGFVSLTSPLVFLLPSEAGEKIDLSITVLLAYSIYLSMISDDLPDTSAYVCLLQLYLAVLLSLTSFAVMLSVIVLRVHHTSPKTRMGPRLVAFIRRIRQIMCLSNSQTNTYNIANIQQIQMTDNSEHTNETEMKVEDVEITWPYVAETLDRLFFILFCLCIISATLVIIPYLAMMAN